LKNLKQISLKKGITAGELVEEMDSCGVLGAGKIGKASRLIKQMFEDSDYTVFLSIAGALVAGGLRTIIAQLLESEHVEVVVTTGANMVHDMLESLGCKHKIGTFRAEDKQLKERDIGRIGDIYIEHQAFRKLERWLYTLLDEIPESKRLRISPSDLLMEIGKRIDDHNSILAIAAKKNIPIICPGLPDSIAGFQLWTYSQDKKLILDSLGDISKLVDKVYEAKKSGVIILGGGMPKHFVLFANTFREGVDTAIQITTDRPEPGGLSGASLEEAISWSKVKSEDNTVTVNCDATIAFPLIIASTLNDG
jgi:deoxyhypusine synthase